MVWGLYFIITLLLAEKAKLDYNFSVDPPEV